MLPNRNDCLLLDDTYCYKYIETYSPQQHQARDAFLSVLDFSIMPAKGRKPLTQDNLERNNITVCREPDETQWPESVSELRSRLIGSFANLVPSSELKVSAPGGPSSVVLVIMSRD